MKDYKRLLSFVRPYVWVFVGAIILMGLNTIIGLVANVGLMVPFVTCIIAREPIKLSTKASDIMVRLVDYLNSFVMSFEILQLLYLLVIVLIVSYFLKVIFTFLQEFLISKLSLNVVRDIKNRLYEKILGLSFNFFSKNKAGTLVSRITYDAGVVQNAISEGLRDLTFHSIQLIGYIIALRIILVNFNIPSSLLFSSFLLIPLIVFAVIKIGRRLRKISTMSQEKMADINAILFETFSGIRIVKAFSMEKYEVNKFHRENQAFFKIMLKSVKRIISISPLTEFITIICVAWIVLVGGKAVVAGSLDSGVFLAFLACISQMITPFKRLSKVHAINQQALAASTRIFDILDTSPTVQEAKDALDIDDLKDDIVLEGVWFRYENKDILKDINLKVKRGEVLAIVGPSGVGKTTLVNLLPRFYDTIKGSILFDGRNIKKATIKSLRGQIGIVTQETILFNDTVKANIAYGSVFDQKKIERAAKVANAHDFIMDLPLGYDTVVGDRGFKLSGGEKQRLAIARAVLKDPPILILDEATSQLDTQSELLVQQAINNLIKGRTVFVIAHRLSTVKGAGRIIVLEEGRIVEEGTHEQLIEKSGLYRKLYELQFEK